MPRARDPKRAEAREMWLASGRNLKLCEISEKLSIPEPTMRAWKAKDEWESEPSKKNVGSAPKNVGSAPKNVGSAPKKKGDAPHPRKRGAQPGNHNGKGAPHGNIQAVTTGAHSLSLRFYGGLFTDEEKAMLEDLERQTERDRLQMLYAQHQMTEKRIMGFIKEIESGAEMITHRTVSQIAPTGKKTANGREITKVVKISQEQETRKEQLRGFYDALTRVRAEMRRTSDSLRQLCETEIKNRENVGALMEDADDELVKALKDRVKDVWRD